MSIAILAKKIDMTSVYDENGNMLPVTLLEVSPHHVVSQKTEAVDGYNAVQFAAGPIKKKPTKPMKGHFAKANVEPKRTLYECRVDDLSQYELGSELTLDAVSEWTHVDAVGLSKGKGFSGVMKVHNFSGQRATHGVSLAHRKPGSSGQCQDPGRIFPGKKMAKRAGNDKVTIQSLKLIEVDSENNLVVVMGSVPGPKGGFVFLKKALKKNRSKS